MGRICQVLVAAISVWPPVPAAEGQLAPRRVWLGPPEERGLNMVVPLTIDDLSEVVAGDLNLVFDPRRTTVVDVQKTSLLSGFLLVHNVDEDTLKISFASIGSGSGSGSFADIVVEDHGTPPAFALLMVSLNGGEIPVEFDAATVVASADRSAVPMCRLSSYPNPFNAGTTLSFRLAGSSRVDLVVYNALGHRVRALVEGERPAGEHRVVWDGTDGQGRSLASGCYVAQLRAEIFRREIGMVLLK